MQLAHQPGALHCCPAAKHTRQLCRAPRTLLLMQQPQAVARRPLRGSLARALPATPATESAEPGSSPQASAVHNAAVAAAAAGAEPRYLSYQEYLETRQQQQQEEQDAAAAAGQRADETAHASTSSASSEGSSTPGKRVPWNKGRKHSAMTIARISEATTRALARPEVRSKLDAWNQSRIGQKLPEAHKARIKERQREALAARREAMSQEELDEYFAKRSALAKRLWQDPEYAARTVSAIQDAGKKRRGVLKKQAAADGDNSSGSSSSSGSGGSKPRSSGTRKRTAAAAGGSSEEPPPETKQKQPTQKELAALAKLQQEHQREQLQKQLDHMLQTQRLIATTEATLVQLRSNMAAFENNPQAKATAAQALRQAEAYLDPARQRVEQLLQSLDEHGVHWDPVSGVMTHIQHEPLDGKKAGRNSSSSSRAKSSSSSSSSSSRKAASAGAAEDGPGPDVVRSSRSKQVQQQQQEQEQHAAAGLVVSSRRRATASDTAAAGGGSSSPPGSPAGVWTPVSGAHSVGSVPANGSSSNGRNGSHGGGGSAAYMPLHMHRAAGDEEL